MGLLPVTFRGLGCWVRLLLVRVDTIVPYFGYWLIGSSILDCPICGVCSVLRVSWILHLKFLGLCLGSPVPGMWAYVLSLVGLHVALFVGFGCCVACWILLVCGDPVSG